MSLFKCSVIVASVRRGRKELVMSAVFIMVLLVPNQHRAATFADDQMLQRLQTEFGAQARQRGIALNTLFADLSGKEVKQQLTKVNHFFNQFKYQDDIKLWKQKDYWATPEEFVGHNSGDCEDYVVAKYFALRALGVPDEHLYLTYVKAIRENVAHMVLSYFQTLQSTPLILDNYNPRILPADKRTDLLPVYSFNAKSLFLTNASAGLGRSLPTDKFKNNKWQKLLNNIKGPTP